MLKKIVIAIASLLVLGYLVWAIYYFSSPKTGGRTGLCTGIEIEIKGDHRSALMSDLDVRAELKRMGFAAEGKPLESIDILDLQNKLRRNKLFRQADVYLTPSGKVHLLLAQHEPLFLVMTSSGRYYISTERGVIPYYPGSAEPHLTVTGTVDTAMATGKLYDLVRVIQASDYWKSLVAQVYVQADSSVLVVPRVGATDIILGKSPDWEPKFDKLKVFIDQVIARTGWDAFKSLNLCYKDQVVAKPTEEFAELQIDKTKVKP